MDYQLWTIIMLTNYLIIITLFLSVPSVAQALEKIKPNTFIAIKAEYNDNIFFKPNPETEFITEIIPGINTRIIANNWLHNIDYRVRFLDYRNIKQKGVRHNLNLTGWHRLSNKLLLSLAGNFIEDKVETIEEDFSVTNREYLKQKFTTAIKFQLKPRLGTNIKYQYEDFDMREEKERDSKENQVFFDTYYLLSERLRVIGVYQYRKKDFKNRHNLKLNRFGMGIQYELSPRIDSKLILEYEEIATERKDPNNFAYQLNLTRQLNKKTTSYLTFERATNFSRSLINPVEVKTAQINIIRQLNEKTNFNLSASSMHSNWQDTTRKDKLQAITSGLSHQISKKISFNINYNYLNRKSNIFDECVKNNTYTVSIQVQ